MNIAQKSVYGRWEWGGTAAILVLESNQDFVASNTEIVERGVYRRVPLVVAGYDFTIPLIPSIPTTTDSNFPDATWSARIFSVDGTKRLDWLLGFQLRHIYSSPAQWENIFVDSAPPGFQPSPNALSREDAIILMQSLAAQIAGNTVAAGNGVLAVAEVTTILDSNVAANSPIMCIPKSEGITGQLRAFNRVPGVSFDVVSDNGADAGNFKWAIYP